MEQSAGIQVARAKSAAAARHNTPWRAPDHYLRKPVNVGIAFEKQITRKEAVYGKLLSDVAMTKMLLGANWGQGGREGYDGATDTMTKPLITRPRSASVGVPFAKQITRKEAVVGKLLTDVAMTRMLLGADWSQGGGDAADPDLDTFLKPPITRKRANLGQHSFNKQMGRVDYHLAGLRAAPAKPGLGERGPPRSALMEETVADPRGSRGASAPPSRTHSSSALRARSVGLSKFGRDRPDPFATLTDVPQRPQPHVRTADFARQLPRERWTQTPMRLQR
jgi:hypothetical protein